MIVSPCRLPCLTRPARELPEALGRLDAGLFFLAYQRSPEQFVTLQRALSTDLMSEYVKHIGSGVWAVPPGATAGSYVGAGLFA